MSPGDRHARYTRALAGEALPLALVDLELFEANIDRVLELVRAGRKRLRVASKSLRCSNLLERVRQRAGDAMIGVMAYTVDEAAFLARAGHRDVLVAYPTLQPRHLGTLAELARRGERVSIVADCEAHVEALERAASGAPIPVLVDVDVSYRPRGLLHVGVRRSPIHDVASAVALAERIHRSPGLELAGVMAYEAHIAGVTDQSPFTPLLEPAKRALKALSRASLEPFRAQLAAALRDRNLPCPIFNGGGTGSLAWCTAEDALTEVTAGSAFLDGHLFDYYRDVRWAPAACFALEVVRLPGPGFATCHGGGYVASGQPGKDRLPLPYLPEGLSLLDLEGAGEVQTPLKLPEGLRLPIGAPVFFRHAKAGELAEHFDAYHLIRGEQVEERVPTYRGEGRCFLG